MRTFFQKKNSQTDTAILIFYARESMARISENASGLSSNETPKALALRHLESIARGLDTGFKTKNEGNEQILRQLSGLETQIPKNVVKPIRTHLDEARKRLENGQSETARTFIEQAQNILEENEDNFWLKQKKNDSNAFLRRADTTNQSPVLSPYIKNPFIGNLKQEVRIDYEILNPKTDKKEIDSVAEREQRALNGLPIFDKNGNPKMYKGTSGDGSKTLYFYWVPNLPGIEYIHLGGHFALTEQRKDIPAFIPHGWIISELQRETDADTIQNLEIKKVNGTLGRQETNAVVENIMGNNSEARNNAADTFQTAMIREIKNERLADQSGEIEISALSVIATNNMEFETIYQSLSKKTAQTYETTQIYKGAQTYETAQLEQGSKKEERMDENSKTEIPEQLAKNALVETLSMLFSKIKTFLVKRTAQQKQTTSESISPELKKEQHEAIQAITFLEQVYANIIPQSMENASRSPIINREELLAPQKNENRDVDQETTEIIQLSRKNLALARAMVQEPLTFND